jgi:hypothetical protein
MVWEDRALMAETLAEAKAAVEMIAHIDRLLAAFGG